MWVLYLKKLLPARMGKFDQDHHAARGKMIKTLQRQSLCGSAHELFPA